MDNEKILESLNQANFPGRFEIFKNQEKIIIVDGAHNRQKMRSFLKTLVKLYPNQKFDFLLAFKEGKDSKEMLKLIKNFADRVIISEFFTKNQDLAHFSQNPTKIQKILTGVGIKKSLIIKNPHQAFEKSLKISKNILVITGSLYFIGEIYPLIKK